VEKQGRERQTVRPEWLGEDMKMVSTDNPLVILILEGKRKAAAGGDTERQGKL
jgi:hypothetical protein